MVAQIRYRVTPRSTVKLPPYNAKSLLYLGRYEFIFEECYDVVQQLSCDVCFKRRCSWTAQQRFEGGVCRSRRLSGYGASKASPLSSVGVVKKKNGRLRFIVPFFQNLRSWKFGLVWLSRSNYSGEPIGLNFSWGLIHGLCSRIFFVTTGVYGQAFWIQMITSNTSFVRKQLPLGRECCITELSVCSLRL